MRKQALVALGVVLGVAGFGFGQGYICAEGGGNEQNGNWAPSVFGWMLEKGGFGDVLVLGTSGSDLQVANTFVQLGAASADNLAIGPVNADTQSVYDAIVAADIVWLRGGDQYQYVNIWNDTLTEQAIRDLYTSGGVIGGTSAGLHVLGEVIFDAEAGSLQPKQALQNAYHPFITLTDDFLELTPGVLFDSHFTERGRVARLAVLLARHFEDTGEDVLGIGVDDRTALCVNPDLTAEVRGEGAVTFLHRTGQTTQILESGEPPVFTNLQHDQLTEGYTYDLANRVVLSRSPNATLVDPPSHTPSFQEVSLNGSFLPDKSKGEFEWLDFNDDFALFYGKMDIVAGDGLLNGAVLSTQTWNSTVWDENRVGGPQLAIHENPHRLAVCMDGNTLIDATGPAMLDVIEPAFGLESSIVLLDSYGMVSTAASTYTSSGQSEGPRQSVAIEDATLHLIRSGWSYDALTHAAIDPNACAADVNGDDVLNILDFIAFQGLFEAGDAAADVNGDGLLNILDFIAFQGLFEAGC